MDNHLVRPALGQAVPIGSLYDARLDRFLDVSFLSPEIAPGVVSEHEKKNVDVRVSYGESYAEGFMAMNIGHDLAASLLTGIVPPTSLTQHLLQPSESDHTLQALISHVLTTKQCRLELTNPNTRQSIAMNQLRTSMATHVVTEIDYGSETHLTVRKWAMTSDKKGSDRSQFKQQVSTFVETLRSPIHGQSHPSAAAFDQIVARSTSLGGVDLVMTDTEETIKFLGLIPLHIRSEGGKGSPVTYRLLPVQMLGFLSLVQVDVDRPLILPSQDCVKKFIQVCDEFRTVEAPLIEYKAFASKYSFCLPPSHADDIAKRLSQLKLASVDFKSAFARTLEGVRNNRNDPEDLWRLINDASQGHRSPKMLSTFAEDFQWKVNFIDSMLTAGATYIGYGSSLDTHLTKRGNGESNVLFFSQDSRRDDEVWQANQALMLTLLQKRKKNTFYAIVDCDAVRMPLDRSTIAQYEGGVQKIADLYDEQQYMAAQCFARFLPQSLETKNVSRPTKRCLVKIPCPGAECSAGDICEWHCSECYAPLEYGYTDQYIYCDCGRSLYKNFDFKCNSQNHGPGFDRYNDTNLLNFLKSLDQSDYLNILILGETGVGKSTFINAFVNYLYFTTLDDALNTEGLQSVIPCSFELQMANGNEFKEVEINVGEKKKSETAGKAAGSVTQQTQVYPITVGASTYRLIDTPGIGDTRGLSQDKKNMVDILATVSGYDHLHGILILMRSNVTRLTPQFSFCLKELLSHLHRNATNNVVFGFTNTRNSNYMPGDTSKTLKALLNEDQEIGLSLTQSTAYCFDSESFRYLAAFKQGVTMENKPDFDNSWNKSRETAERMLAYFRSKEPHPVKSTMSLNGTRQLIAQLTKPMAEISKQINANIATMDDDVKILQDTRLTGDKLQAKLRPEISYLKMTDLEDPRTVCTGQGCIQPKDDGLGKGNLIDDYPNPCHAPCGLDNVPVNVLAHTDLMYCAAFQMKEQCQRCNHHWTLHKHIMYVLEVYKARITDTTIEAQIKAHTSDITMKETAINKRKQLMVEYQAEHKAIGEAAAKFGLWMKANSILPINDATLAYIEMLIKAEEIKVDAGGIGNKKVLADLEEDKRKHLELVDILTASMKSTGRAQPIEQDEVQKIVQSLYNLRHFGGNLKKLQLGITQSHAATNRELPHRVSHRHVQRSHARSSSRQPPLVPTQQRQYQQQYPHQHQSQQYSHQQHQHSQSSLHASPHQSGHPSNGPNRLQRPQSMQPGFSSGTMRPGSAASSAHGVQSSGGLTPMPGSFIAEVPDRGPRREKSQKSKSGWSFNPFS